MKTPIQLWRPEDDQLLLYPDHAQAIYEALAVKPEYHVVPNAGHYSVLAPCDEELAVAVPATCKDGPNFDRVAFHETFNADVAAFFDKYFWPQ